MIVQVNKYVDDDIYRRDRNNDGKIAIYDIDNKSVIAEGNTDEDNLEVILMCEELNKNGRHCTIIFAQDINKLRLPLYGEVVRFE